MSAMTREEMDVAEKIAWSLTDSDPYEDEGIEIDFARPRGGAFFAACSARVCGEGLDGAYEVEIRVRKIR